MAVLDDILNPNQQQPPKPQQKEQVQQPQQQVTQPAAMSYTDMTKQLQPDPKVEFEQQQKRLKREATFAMLSDGLAAFHNAYAHARGITPMRC